VDVIIHSMWFWGMITSPKSDNRIPHGNSLRQNTYHSRMSQV
jgi:hypothetical protein